MTWECAQFFTLISLTHSSAAQQSLQALQADSVDLRLLACVCVCTPFLWPRNEFTVNTYYKWRPCPFVSPEHLPLTRLCVIGKKMLQNGVKLV